MEEEEERIPTVCAACGKDPAEGFASRWTENGGTERLCHGVTKDAFGRTCYMNAVGSS